MALLTFIVVVFFFLLQLFSTHYDVKSIGCSFVELLCPYSVICSFFFFVLYFRSIWMNLHVVSWVYCIVYNTLGSVYYNIKMAKKNITKKLRVFGKSRKMIENLVKICDLFLLYILGRRQEGGNTKFKCMQFLAMNFFLTFLLCHLDFVLIVVMYVIGIVTRCRLIHHLVISQQFMTFLGTFRFICSNEKFGE